jgi:hypothetical protein
MKGSTLAFYSCSFYTSTRFILFLTNQPHSLENHPASPAAFVVFSCHCSTHFLENAACHQAPIGTASLSATEATLEASPTDPQVSHAI